MTADRVGAWLASAVADAKARGLPELQPLLQALARSTQALRDADAEFGHPAGRHDTSVADEEAAPTADVTHPAADPTDHDHGAQ